jgi:hypothetical protein
MATKKKKKAVAKKRPAKKSAVKASPDAMHAFLSQGRDGLVTYMLRTCAADMSAHGGFIWPREGAVECPDWNPRAECGNGLHGLLMGEGDPSLTSGAEDAVWMVCAVWADDVVSIGSDKVKAPRSWVVFCGKRDEAVAKIQRLGAVRPIYGTATAGYAGTATAGYAGTATAGDGGTATAGARGTATAGDGGTATAGYAGTATAGYAGTATAGYAGTATAGDDGIVCIKHWNGRRYRMKVAHVGEDGILPNRRYKLDADGSFVLADAEAPHV